MSPRSIEFPVEGLSDGVVRLRLIADADVPAIVDAVQDPEIPRYTTVPDPYGDDEARQWQRMRATGLAAGTDLAALIVDAGDGALLGAVGLHDLDPASGRCSAGYWVAAPARGRGVATPRPALLCALRVRASSASQRIELWIEPGNARLAAGRRGGRLRARGPAALVHARSAASAATCSCTRSCRATSR